MKSKLYFTILAALILSTVSLFAQSYTNDFKDARVLVGQKKYAEAKAAYQSIASKETGYAKDIALVNAACMSVYLDKVNGFSELEALESNNAVATWVSMKVRVAGSKASEVESKAMSVVSSTTASDPEKAKVYASLFDAYAREKQWAKAKLQATSLASVEPRLMIVPLFSLTKNSLEAFPAKTEQVEFYKNMVRVIPAIEKNSKVLGLIKSQLELLK